MPATGAMAAPAMPSKWTCSVTLFARAEICCLLLPASPIAVNSCRDLHLFAALLGCYARQAGSKISSREISSDFRRARTPNGSVNMGRGV